MSSDLSKPGIRDSLIIPRGLWSSQKIDAEISAVAGAYAYRAECIDYVNNTAAPPTEVLGDRYILDDTGASHANWDGVPALSIAYFNGTTWDTITPSSGWRCYVANEGQDRAYIDDGTPAWENRPSQHIIGGVQHTADTIANLNTKVSDRVLDGTVDPRDPNAHAPSHVPGESDEITELTSFISAILETIAVTVVEDTGTVYLKLEKAGTGDITIIFSDGHHTFDCTPIAQVALTAGTDTVPILNYIYILQSTKALTVSTAGWPTAEYAPIATVLVQSTTGVASDGAYKVHAWLDHIISPDGNGHISEAYKWIRQQHATYLSGVGQTLTITPASPDTVIFTTAAGVVQQLHEHTFPAFGGTPDLYVVNDFSTAYDKITDLAVLLTDSANGSMSGRYFSLVIWGCLSEGAANCKLFVNLPSGSYNTQSGLIADNNKYADYSIPAEFKGTGFLIAELKLQHQVSGGGDWTSIQEIDLRGSFPNLTAGGGSIAGNEFPDSVFRILDDSDPTKEIAFQASGISTATTRTITTPDADITIDDDDSPRPADEIITTTGPTTMAVGAVADGEFLKRSGSAVIGSTPTGMARFFVPAPELNFSLGAHRVRVITGTGNHRFSFPIPGDFVSLISLVLIARSTVTVSADIDVSSDYGKTGASEDYNNHSEARDGGTTPTSLTANQMVRIDVSDVFSNLEALDVCGFNWDHNSIGGNVYYWGIEVRYNT